MLLYIYIVGIHNLSFATKQTPFYKKKHVSLKQLIIRLIGFSTVF